MTPQYQVLQRPIREAIQRRVPLRADRLVIHSTANAGATDEGHFVWLDGAERHGWAHYYLDWDSISQLVSEGFVAPAQGPTFNARSLSMELCEPLTNVSQAEQRRMFDEVWRRGVWLASDILWRYGWQLDQMISHADVSRLVPRETDHTDPHGFFARYGRSWGDWLDAVRDELETRRRGHPDAAAWQYEPVQALVDDGLLHELRHPRQRVEWWELGYMLQRNREAAVQDVLAALKQSTVKGGGLNWRGNQ